MHHSDISIERPLGVASIFLQTACAYNGLKYRIHTDDAGVDTLALWLVWTAGCIVGVDASTSVSWLVCGNCASADLTSTDR